MQSCSMFNMVPFVQELKYGRLLSLPANGVSQGFSTVIPGSGELPEWISHQGIDGINANNAQPDFIPSCENLIGINLIE